MRTKSLSRGRTARSFCKPLRAIEFRCKAYFLIERGKDVPTEDVDLAAINKAIIVNPDSQLLLLGEGRKQGPIGCKLYTRSEKAGRYSKESGEFLWRKWCTKDIPSGRAIRHIGTNKLPEVGGRLRQSIFGIMVEEIHFETKS